MSKFEKVKKHLKANAKTYLIGTGCFLLGVGIGALYVCATPELKNDLRVTARGIFYKSPITQANTVITILERRGHPGNKILCNETGEVFASQSRAATANNIDAADLSKHLKGIKDSVKGLTFKNLGEME